MPSAPSLHQLAEAALDSDAMTDARRLAEWIGDGRELTASGVLRPAVAVEACRELGFALPASGKLRSAMDSGELHRAWSAAIAADLIRAAGKRALRAAPDPQDSSERVVSSWVSAAALPFDLTDDPCLACLSVLHELCTAGKPVEMAALADAARETIEGPAASGGDEDVCPDCGESHEGDPLTDMLTGGLFGLGDFLEEEAEGHAMEVAQTLLYFGAAITGPGTAPGGTVTLTPLGRLLAERIMAVLTPDPAADAATLTGHVASLPPRIKRSAIAPWFAARKPEDAVRELLGYARREDCAERPVALELAKEPGPPGLAAWRELAAEPGFGAYARQWLASQGEPVTEHENDEAWLLTDAVALASRTAPLPVVAALFGGGLAELTEQEASEVITDVRECGHPSAGEVADLLGGSPFAVPGFYDEDEDDDDLGEYDNDVPEGTLYQLKITLKGVSKPPVWRRVRVPAGIMLDELHEVIRLAMGWSGAHMHVFADDIMEFGLPDPDLGHADEEEFELADLVSEVGEHITYTYDFGDDWQHVIKLEKIIEPGTPDAARTTPECLAGKGACPPEDCGGSWAYAELKEVLADPSHEDHEDLLGWLGLDDPSSFDPAAFDPGRVNTRLRALWSQLTSVLGSRRRVPRTWRIDLPWACQSQDQEAPPYASGPQACWQGAAREGPVRREGREP